MSKGDSGRGTKKPMKCSLTPRSQRKGAVLRQRPRRAHSTPQSQPVFTVQKSKSLI